MHPSICACLHLHVQYWSCISLSLSLLCVRESLWFFVFFCASAFFFMSVGLMTKSVFGILSNCGIAFINRIEKAL